MTVSVNERAVKLTEWGISHREELGILVESEPDTGAVILDLGVKTKGTSIAGKFMTEVCLANLGQVSISQIAFGNLLLPAITVTTDFPSVATLGSQFAGWQIKTANYFAMGSGPARAIALKPKDLYRKINYKDEFEKTVIVLESEKYPDAEAIRYVADECNVDAKNVYALVAPTSSLAGSVQISGRIVEAGVHRLTEIGFDPEKIRYGCGYAPIAPIHPKGAVAMGRTNDAITYGGVTSYTVESTDDSKLKEIIRKAPSSASKDYGKTFYEAFKEVQYDFYKMDPGLFAPGMFIVNNALTGTTYMSGKINDEILKQTMGIQPA
jgi:methenyltetrahydromethanopterin cyclohydrolase